MELTPLKLFLLCTLSSLLLASPLPEQSSVDAIPDYRIMRLIGQSMFHAPGPSIYAGVDVIHGFAGLNRTAEGYRYRGFPTYIKEIPPNDGKLRLLSGLLLKKEDHGPDTPAFLSPTNVSGLYDFGFGPVPHRQPGVLHRDFQEIVIECGGQCGGIGLGYKTTGTNYGSWVVYRDLDNVNGYKLGWFNGTQRLGPEYQHVFLWIYK